MRKLVILTMGSVILLPFVFIICNSNWICGILSLVAILAITMTGDRKDRLFWGLYWKYLKSIVKKLFPLPKELSL